MNTHIIAELDTVVIPSNNINTVEVETTLTGVLLKEFKNSVRKSVTQQAIPTTTHMATQTVPLLIWQFPIM